MLRNAFNFDVSSGVLSNAAGGTEVVVSVDFVEVATEGAGDSRVSVEFPPEEDMARKETKGFLQRNRLAFVASKDSSLCCLVANRGH